MKCVCNSYVMGPFIDLKRIFAGMKFSNNEKTIAKIESYFQSEIYITTMEKSTSVQGKIVHSIRFGSSICFWKLPEEA